ncbi:MAG: polysulfide reductase NrfD [Candidatus Marinimicrobia bacterium]|nr:polysulfide reductase NrfD [Candidatus Neomarinimicrobiota bacterium]
MMAIWSLFMGELSVASEMNGLIVSLLFMGLTGGLLVKDLDRPDRFLYVLLRPQWKSWLVRGAYIITVFGGLITMKLMGNIFEISMDLVWMIGGVFAILGAIYTAFLFNQARARDLWQTPIQSAIHMLLHAVMAGSVVMMFIAPESFQWMTNILFWGIIANVIIIAKEILMPHDTPDTKKAIHLMTKGYYSKYFWFGITFGNLGSAVILFTLTGNWILLAGAMALVGIYLTEYVRIRVPQMIPLS